MCALLIEKKRLVEDPNLHQLTHTSIRLHQAAIGCFRTWSTYPKWLCSQSLWIASEWNWACVDLGGPGEVAGLGPWSASDWMARQPFLWACLPTGAPCLAKDPWCVHQNFSTALHSCHSPTHTHIFWEAWPMTPCPWHPAHATLPPLGTRSGEI